MAGTGRSRGNRWAPFATAGALLLLFVVVPFVRWLVVAVLLTAVAFAVGMDVTISGRGLFCHSYPKEFSFTCAVRLR